MNCTAQFGASSCVLAESHEGIHMTSRDRERSSRISFLERKREATKADLLLKFEDGDWHGVCDAGMDLRDIDSELKGLSF